MKEKISALIDDELHELEERRVLSALAEDTELRRTWGRYHVIRAAMTRQLATLAPLDLPERVAACLDTQHQSTRAPLRFWPLAAGFAVAASVAAVAIVGLQTLRGPIAPTTVPTLAVAPAVSETVKPATAALETDSAERLSLYLVGHNEIMPTAGMGSMLPYVRVVAHDPDR